MPNKLTRLGVAMAALTLLLALAPAALAGPPSESGAVLRGPHPASYLYWEGDYLVLMANDNFTEGCLDQGFQEATASTVGAGNGTNITHFSEADVEILVFDVDFTTLDDIWVWLGEQCYEAVVNGSPPTPVAEGSGQLTVSSRMDTDGILHDHNGVRGKVTTTGGETVHLSTFAQLTIDTSTGEMDVAQLTVNYGG